MVNNTSKQILLSVIGVAVLIIAVIGVSFAFFAYTRIGAANNNIIGAGKGTIDFKFIEGNSINLVNQYPMSSEEGRNLLTEGQVCRFTISGKANDGSINYVIKLVPGDQDENRVKFQDSEVFAYISSPELEGLSFTPRGAYGTVGQAVGNREVILGTGTLTSKDQIEGEFEVRIWVDDSVVLVGEEGTYTPEEISNMYYSMKVVAEIQNNS